MFRGTIPDLLIRPLAASLGAFCATAPVISGAFAVLHPAGILAGLLIVPLSMVFMIAALIYLVLPILASPVGTGLGLLYTILNRLVHTASLLPSLDAASPGVVLGAVLGLGALVWALYRRLHRERNRFESFDGGC
jgi:competence protein ComEC